MILFLDYTKFGFELISQKMFEMKNLKNDPLHISCHFQFENDSLSKC
jgi:hypothetical protein